MIPMAYTRWQVNGNRDFGKYRRSRKKSLVYHVITNGKRRPPNAAALYGLKTYCRGRSMSRPC